MRKQVTAFSLAHPKEILEGNERFLGMLSGRCHIRCHGASLSQTDAASWAACPARWLHTASLLWRTRVYFFQRSPEAQASVATLGTTSKPRCPAIALSRTACYPALRPRAPSELFLALGPNNNKHAGTPYSHADLEVQPVSPEVDTPLVRGVPLVPLPVLPGLFESADRRWRQVAGLRLPYGLQSQREFVGRDSPQIQGRNECISRS